MKVRVTTSKWVKQSSSAEVELEEGDLEFLRMLVGGLAATQVRDLFPSTRGDALVPDRLMRCYKALGELV